MSKRFLIDLKISQISIFPVVSNLKLNDISIGFICYPKYCTTSNIPIENFEQVDSGILECTCDEKLALVVITNDLSKEGIIVISYNPSPSDSNNHESSPICLGFCQLSVLEVEEGSLNLELLNKSEVVASIECSVQCTFLEEENDECIFLDGILDFIQDPDPISHISSYYDTSQLISSSTDRLQNELTSSIIKKIEDSRKRAVKRADMRETELIQTKSKLTELLRYKVLAETLQRRDIQMQEEIKRLQEEKSLLINSDSMSAEAGLQSQVTELTEALQKERETLEVLRRELAVGVSREELHQLRADVESSRTDAKAAEEALNSLALSLAQDGITTYVKMPSEASMQTELKSMRVELEKQAVTMAELTYQRDTLLRHNEALSHQVASLLSNMGLKPREFPSDLSTVSSDLITSEIQAGAVHPLAGPSSAAQFAIIADLERSLQYYTSVAIDQAAKLRRKEKQFPLDGDVEQNEICAETEDEDAPSRMQELEEELEQARALAETYYEKLQSGSSFLKSQRAQLEQTQAELEAVKTDKTDLESKLEQLQAELKAALEAKDAINNQSASVLPAAEDEDAPSRMQELEEELEQARALAETYYEKLQSGSSFLKSQRAQLEQTQAELEAVKTDKTDLESKLEQLQAELKAALEAKDAINNQSASVLPAAEDEDAPSRMQELEEELEQARALAETYYEKLQSGSSFLKSQRAQLEQTQAELEAVKTDKTDLESKLEQLQAELKAALEAKDAINNQSASVLPAAEDEDAPSRMQELEEELEQARALAETYYEKLQSGSSFLKSQRAQLEQTQAELEAVKTDKTDLESKLEQLQAELKAALEAKDAINNQSASVLPAAEDEDAPSRMQELEEELEQARALAETYYEKLQSGSSFLKSQRAQLEQTQAELEAVKTDKTDLESKLEQLQAELKAALEAKDAINNQSASVLPAAEDEDAPSRMQELEEELEQARALAETYYEKLQSGSSFLKSQRAQLEQTQAELEAVKTDKTDLESKLEQLQAELKAALEAKDAINNQSASVLPAAEDEDAPSRMQELEEELEQARALAETYYEKLQSGSSFLKSQRAQLEQTQAELEAVKTDKTDLESKLEQLQAELKAALEAKDAINNQSASVLPAAEDEDAPNRMQELEEELEQARALAETYYEKLQSGSSFLKSQRAQLEQTQAELAAMSKQKVIAEAKLQKAEDELELTLSRYTEMQNTANKSEVSHSNQDQSIIQITADLNTTREALTKAETLAKEKDQLAEAMRQEKDRLKAETEDFKSKLSAAEELLKQQTSVIQSHATRLQQSLEHSHTVETELSSISAEKEIYQTKAEKLQEEVNSLLIQVSLFQSVAEQAEDNQVRRDKESRLMMTEVQARDEENQLAVASLREKINVLTRNEEESRKVVQNLQQKLAAHQQEVEASSPSSSVLRVNSDSDLNTITAKCRELEARCVTLEKEKTEIEERLAQLSSQTVPETTNGHVEPSPSQSEEELAHILQSLIASKMEAAHMATELEEQRQITRTLRNQLAQERSKLAALDAKTSIQGSAPTSASKAKKGTFG